jgi:anti-sigma B factor antagonist
MSLTITNKMLGDIAVCSLVGRLTLSTTGLFRDYAKALFADGTIRLIFDISEVSYVDSTGLADLVAIYTTARNRGGNLVLLRPSVKVHDLFKITKTYTIFPIHDNLEDALAFLATKTQEGKG